MLEIINHAIAREICKLVRFLNERRCVVFNSIFVFNGFHILILRSSIIFSSIGERERGGGRETDRQTETKSREKEGMKTCTKYFLLYILSE